jgi:ParB/RepB/Spo0J family partition protein
MVSKRNPTSEGGKVKRPFNRAPGSRNIDELLGEDAPTTGPGDLGQAFLASASVRPPKRMSPPPSAAPVEPSPDTPVDGQPKADDGPSARSEIASAIAGLQTVKSDTDGVMMAMSAIVENPKLQPRLRLSEQHVVGLADKFQKSGQLNAILVRPVEGTDKYEIIGGNHRFNAAKRIGWTSIRVNIKHVSFEEARLMAVDDNDSMLPRSDYEKALSYQALLDDGIVGSHQELADRFGVSRGRISQCLTFVSLPKAVLEYLDDYPELFSYRTAADLKKVLSAHSDAEGKPKPNVVETMAAGVLRLIDGAPLTGLIHWIEQKLSGNTPFHTKVEPRIVLDAEGRTAFRTKGKDNSVVVEWDKKIPYNAHDVQEALMIALKSLAEKSSPSGDEA